MWWWWRGREFSVLNFDWCLAQSRNKNYSHWHYFKQLWSLSACVYYVTSKHYFQYESINFIFPSTDSRCACSSVHASLWENILCLKTLLFKYFVTFSLSSALHRCAVCTRYTILHCVHTIVYNVYTILYNYDLDDLYRCSNRNTHTIYFFHQEHA